MKRPFEEMPDEARLWVFASPRPLEPEEAERLLHRVDTFVEGWLAHGHPVAGARDWRDDRFLLLAADEAATGVSGCSIDSLYDALKAAEREMDARLLDASSRVWYRDAAGSVQSVPRPDFRALVRDGEVGPDTPVFDNTVPTVGALRAGGWERPMRESWHGRMFNFEF
jgi:hypothetical protein